jgi:site-specific DNA-cytosine methylase
MDVDEANIDKMLTAGISDSQLYRMAGNSIVVACMEGIFRNLFSTEEQELEGQLTLF